MNIQEDHKNFRTAAAMIDSASRSAPMYFIRKPEPEDGPGVHRLVADCPPLDPNSLYCNLLQCSHFAETSALAERDGDIVGFVSGYLKQNGPSTLFIWQVAVGEDARGQGLAQALIRDILARPACSAVCRIETTITDDNKASWAMFGSLAQKLSAPQKRRLLFDRDIHLGGRHPSEHLLCIGPFEPAMKDLI